jgi:Tol biopolymer transport system component
VSSPNLVELSALASAQKFRTLGDVAWSPNGDQLLYVVTKNHVNPAAGGFCEGTTSSLYTMGADGQSRRLLLTEAEIWVWAWSPDGSAIAFLGCATRLRASCGLYTVSSDGTGERFLARTPGGRKPAWIGGTILVDSGTVAKLAAVDASSGVTRVLSVPQSATGIHRDCLPEGATLLAVSGRRKVDRDPRARVLQLQ